MRNEKNLLHFSKCMDKIILPQSSKIWNQGILQTDTGRETHQAKARFEFSISDSTWNNDNSLKYHIHFDGITDRFS